MHLDRPFCAIARTRGRRTLHIMGTIPTASEVDRQSLAGMHQNSSAYILMRLVPGYFAVCGGSNHWPNRPRPVVRFSAPLSRTSHLPPRAPATPTPSPLARSHARVPRIAPHVQRTLGARTLRPADCRSRARRGPRGISLHPAPSKEHAVTSRRQARRAAHNEASLTLAAAPR